MTTATACHDPEAGALRICPHHFDKAADRNVRMARRFTPYFPPLPKRLDLELIEAQTFSQVVYLRYRRS
jgi:hypothetical protein